MKHTSRLTHLFGRTILLAMVSYGSAGQMSFAQEAPPSGPLSLQQCIQYGLSHNRGVIKSKLDIVRSDERVGEAISGYLPQVNGSASMINNLQLQTSILPGEIFGQPGQKVAVQFGTKYNVVAGIDASQVLFDQSIFYGLKAAKENSAMSQLSQQKTEQQLMYDIAAAYYTAQVTFTQHQLIESNLSQIDTVLRLTRIQLDNGFAKQLDVDRLVVSQTNLQTDLMNARSNFDQQLLLLKYLMGAPLDAKIEVPAFNPNETAVSSPGHAEGIDMTDVLLLQGQRTLTELSMREIKSNYLPSLSLNYHYAYQVQQNDLRIFSNSATWFPNSYIGLNLKVPVFDGLLKHSQTKQLKVELEQSQLDEIQLTESLKMQRENASMKLRVNLSALESQRRNIELAQKIYETTRVQFTGGIATMTEVVNAETSLKDAQTNYLRSLIQVKLAELELIKSTGNISTLK